MNYVLPAQAGRILERKSHLRVLDAFFGLGYNTWVLLEDLASDPSNAGAVEITAVDLDPSNVMLFPEILRHERLQRVASRFDGTCYSANKQTRLQTYGFDLTSKLSCSISLHHCDARSLISTLTEDYDLIFHDPFSPARVPELWTAEMFVDYFRLLSGTEGRFMTYSSASAVRGGLIEAGFTLYRTIAVGEKSGGTLAIAYRKEHEVHIKDGVPSAIDSGYVFSLDANERRKISSSSGIPYRCRDLNDGRQAIRERRTLEQGAVMESALLC